MSFLRCLIYIPCLTIDLSRLISNWICAAKARHGQTQNPELTALLMRCERLAQLPITPHFIFDGPERPALKRGKVVKGTDHWLVDPFKAILDAYGFRHTAVSGLSIFDDHFDYFEIIS